MKKILGKITVGEDITLYIQRLDYECTGLRNLNCQLIRCGEGNPKSRAEWLERYVAAHSERQIAIDETVKELMPEYSEPDTQFYLDYKMSELIAYQEIRE